MNKDNRDSKTLQVEKYKKPVKPSERKLYAYVEEGAKSIAADIYKLIIDAPVDKGGLVYVYGPVNSGKSILACELIRILNLNRKKLRRSAVCAQPYVDRPDVVKGMIYSRDGVTCPAFSFKTKTEIEAMFHDHSIVIIDEVQFIPFEMQVYFYFELQRFINRGGWAIVNTLRHTSQKMEFILPALLYLQANHRYQFTATCQMCGKRGAKWNQRLVAGKAARIYAPDLQPPNGNTTYEPRCDACLVR